MGKIHRDWWSRLRRTILVTALAVVVQPWIVVASAKEKTDFNGDYASHLSRINPDFMITVQEGYNWHAAKDALGPAFAGNPSWQIFLSIVERKLRDYGAVQWSWTGLQLQPIRDFRS